MGLPSSGSTTIEDSSEGTGNSSPQRRRWQGGVQEDHGELEEQHQHHQGPEVVAHVVDGETHDMQTSNKPIVEGVENEAMQPWRVHQDTGDVVQRENDHRNEEAITAWAEIPACHAVVKACKIPEQVSSEKPVSTQALVPNHRDDHDHHQDDIHAIEVTSAEEALQASCTKSCTSRERP